MTSLFGSSWQEIWGTSAPTEVGSVYTKPEIVELILDAAGFVGETANLVERRILEPSCGSGEFVKSIVRRLLRSAERGRSAIDWTNPHLNESVRAFDISMAAVLQCQHNLLEILLEAGCPPSRAKSLVSQWITCEDFLLSNQSGSYDWIVGNPPYVRLEDLPKAVLAEYRAKYLTLTERADLYIAFFERGLSLLTKEGSLAFICANRFARNRYGGSLRAAISAHYRVRAYINLEHTQPFATDVSAYPAIVVLDRQKGSPTLAGTIDSIAIGELDAISAQFKSGDEEAGPLARFREWYPGGQPWRTTDAATLELVQVLDSGFPCLQDSGAGTVVGIGVATGADQVFVLNGKQHAIEDSRLIPLAMSRDLSAGSYSWSGHYLVNPYDEASGLLVDLAKYPGLNAYLQANEKLLRHRYVARNSPNAWYRTIDRIWSSLTSTPKLLIPDIQAGGVVAHDEGSVYPHHNLYYVRSDEWNLRALQAILRSSIARFQLSTLSVEMRGGSLRYQAQSLRKVRIPHYCSLTNEHVSTLVACAESTDQARIDAAAIQAYGLGNQWTGLITQQGEAHC